MNSSTLTPEESLLLITKTIEETKERFKEYGSVFIFWGSLMLIVFGSQLVLSLLELYKFTIVPVYLFPIGAIITAIWAWKDYKKTNNDAYLALSLVFLPLVFVSSLKTFFFYYLKQI